MQNIKVLYAEVECDGRFYIYAPEGKPTTLKTGRPYCDRTDVEAEIAVTLDAASLYPVEGLDADDAARLVSDNVK